MRTKIATSYRLKFLKREVRETDSTNKERRPPFIWLFKGKKILDMALPNKEGSPQGDIESRSRVEND